MIKTHPLRTFLHIILIGLFLALGACSTTKKDGPPSYYVDVSKIKDPTPKAEPLSKYGNNPSYTVFGKRYHVMRSSRNYEEQGTASWYGTKFHAQRTSSGERYDMLAMTAAHKTLPLPTYVQVTNLANGKKVVVKVNDRGPFEGNRLIDLSYVAAKKIGMLGHGTAYVDIKAIDPMRYDKNIIDQPVRSHDFYLAQNNVTLPRPLVHHAAHHNQSIVYVQVGAFRSKLLAERQRKRLMSMFASSNIKITHSAKQHWYRVQIGPITDLALAKRITERLKAAGLNSKKTTQLAEV
ncbi:MAG: hypothetical protein ACD_60C00029G0029 [uncultured bacterium]|nr:MAG: hypothetical protein ACD_60C00029G0029 [uncultured bacterium]